MGTVRAASFNRATMSPTLATAASGQLLHTGGPATITVVANANLQTLVVQPTAIVNQSPPHHRITLDRNCNSDNILHSPNGKRSPLKSDDDIVGNITENGEDRMVERNAKAIVENTHYITVPADNTVTSRSYTSLTPVTPAIVQEAETITSDGVSHPTYVQYVDGTTDQTIYTTNGQMAYPVYTVGSESGTTMYTSSAQYFQPSNSTPVAYSQVIRVANSLGTSSNQAQIINNGSYLIQQHVDSEHDTPTSDVSYLVNSNTGGSLATVVTAPVVNNNTANDCNASNNSSGNNSDSSNSITHVTRIPPITVQWLLENYETADGVSLPRSTLYFYYIHHCNESKLDPVNAASFGKLIRSVFLGLRTRRLGTRGNSKYHYYGIRLKTNSPLHQLSVHEENGSSQSRANGNSGCQSQKKFKSIKSDSNDSHYHDQNYSNSYHSETSQQSQNRQFLGDSACAIPDFPEIDVVKLSLPDDCSLEDVDTFRSIYREHCEMFLHAVENLEFTTIESLWREFWRCQDTLDDCEEEKYLSKTKLYLLSKCPAVQQFVQYVDYRFYQNLVTFLVPDVLRPIPSSLTQSIRNFAKSLESWLTSAMIGCPKDMILIKAAAVGAFSQTLRRYTSLNHLAQAARAVLQNSTQINQMLADLNKVDFHNVQEQASWVCQCDTALVERLEEDFKCTLQQQNSLEEWANWLKSVVDEVLKPHEGKPSYIKAARQFLLKWSFYSSMVIRDLTLRSAASFGSFHLIRLLYDEYMFYIIEHQIARVTGETPIAVMGGEKYLSDSSTIIECSLMVDTSDCPNEEISLEQLDETTSSLLMDPDDIHIISPPKRMKLS